MRAPIIAFFNNKGGVGKTSLVFHVAWMFSDLGVRVVAADLDPQANLTAAFVDETELERIWPEGRHPTIFGAGHPLVAGTGDIADPALEAVSHNLALLPGDLALSLFEEDLSAQWNQCLSGNPRAFRVISAFWRVLQSASIQHDADVVLMDLGPNLGAINRAALIAADFIVIPVAPDLFSLQGLRNLGPTFVKWRREWTDRLQRSRSLGPQDQLELPLGQMKPIGYVMLQHAERLSRPTRAYENWADRIPAEYRRHVLQSAAALDPSVAGDPERLASLKHYRSLMPMAQEASKPVFHLKPADGAIGAHQSAVQAAYEDFKSLALAIAGRTGVAVPALDS